MGIPGLTGYINSIASLWTTIDLQDTKLVIDGSCLCHYLYVNNGFADCPCGGQYVEFYHAVVSFFDVLNSKGVECFVIIDGADDPSDKKLDTLKSEADTEIASLAQVWNCPVLSNDSDFFIFDIKAGYIPLAFLNWSSNRLTASIFYRRKLAPHFRIHAKLIPLLASLAGNDYVSPNALAAFNCVLSRFQTASHLRRREARFASIAYLLNKLPDSCTQEEALESILQLISSLQIRDELRQAVEFSLQEYNSSQSNLVGYFDSGAVCSSLRTQNGSEIADWVLCQFHSGQFSIKSMSILTGGKCLLRVQVENCGEVSANCCSLSLRRFVYGILNNVGENKGRKGDIALVQEWDREDMMVKGSNVAPYPEGMVPCASLIPYLSTEERLRVLLFALDADTPYIKSLPEKQKLFAASVRYFINNAQPAVKMHHLLALLCCCVNLQEDLVQEKGRSVNRKCSSQSFDLQAAHSFSQWQCVLRDAVQLNYTLLEPVTTPCMHKIFNGQMVHSLREELCQGRTPEEVIPSPKLFGLFQKLKMAVTNGLLHKIALEERQGGIDVMTCYCFLFWFVFISLFLALCLFTFFTCF